MVWLLIFIVNKSTPSDSTASGAPGFSTADPSLGSFFKDVSAAPQLSVKTGGTGEDLAATLETWSSQLDRFETRAAEYDDLLDTMGSGSEAEAEADP